MPQLFYKAANGQLIPITTYTVNDTTKVSLSGDETIAGNKTFSGQVILPAANGLRVGPQHAQSDGALTVNVDTSAYLYLFSNSAGKNSIRGWLAGGTAASRTAISTAGRVLLELDGRAWSGSNYRRGAVISMETDTGTYSDSSMPGRITFSTAPDGSVGPVERMRIGSTGKVTVYSGLDVNSQKITSLATPAAATDAATKGYVDGVLPYNIVVPSTMPPNAASGAMTYGYVANCVYNHIGYVTSGAQNNYMEWSVVAAAGTYTLRVVYISSTNRGIATVAVNGNSAGTIDMYSASVDVLNVAASITGITLTAGLNTIRFTGATKNASSSSYLVTPQGWTLTRTGA